MLDYEEYDEEQGVAPIAETKADDSKEKKEIKVVIQPLRNLLARPRHQLTRALPASPLLVHLLHTHHFIFSPLLLRHSSGIIHRCPLERLQGLSPQG
jgi:hypothetical protein